MNKTVTNMERIIAKIDNDFNPDNSDWIPRVAAWAIDAVAILKCLEETTTVKQYEVVDRIAYNKCGFGDKITKVFDENGCIIDEYDGKGSCSCNSGSLFTGGRTDAGVAATVAVTDTMKVTRTNYPGAGVTVVEETTVGSSPMNHRVVQFNPANVINRNYVKIGNDKIELNYDAKFITVETTSIKTEYSDTFGCEIPVIPNNGLLIECIVAWCMYKMLCRGYKHPIFNLRDNSPATNPFVFWSQNSSKAKDSITLDKQGDINSNLWHSAFYIETFNPRR